MMKRSILLFVLTLTSFVSITAQNNIENKDTTSQIVIYDNDHIKPLSSDTVSSISTLSTESYQFSFLSNPYTIPLRFNPPMWNYDFSSTHKLFPNFSYNLFNQEEIFFGLGGYSNRGISFLWMPSNALSLRGNVFISEQFDYIFNSRQVFRGANLMLNYDFTDKWQLSIWGQYLTPITPTNNNSIINENYLFPKSEAKVGIYYKASKNVRVGAEEEFHKSPKKRGWTPNSLGNVKIGF